MKKFENVASGEPGKHPAWGAKQGGVQETAGSCCKLFSVVGLFQLSACTVFINLYNLFFKVA